MPTSARGRTSGAGTITANYDGVRKHHTEIGERRVPGRRHDAARAGHARRRGEDRRRRRGHAGTCRPASSPSASRPGSASRGRRRAAPARGRRADAAAAPEPTRRRPVTSPAERPPPDGLPRRDRWSSSSSTLLDGIFVAAEIALVSLRRSRVDQLVDEGRRGRPRASGACSTTRAASWPSSSSAITFIGFLASAFAAVSLADGLADAPRGDRRGCGTRRRRSP